MADGKSPEFGLRLGMTKDHGLALKRDESPHTLSRRRAIRALIGAGVAAVGVATWKDKVIGEVEEKLHDLQETSEQKRAAVVFDEALKSGDSSIVRHVMADPKSAIDINFRRRPGTMIEGPGGLVVEDPMSKIKPGTIFGSGLVVEGMDPEHPEDPRKRSLWVVVKHPKTGETGFIQADNIELGGYPTGTIYKTQPKSLK